MTPPCRLALAWTTAREARSAYFAVERGPDGTTWTTIATVTAAGSSASARAYAWLDAAAPAGTSYYCLRQADQDGTLSYSSAQTGILKN